MRSTKRWNITSAGAGGMAGSKPGRLPFCVLAARVNCETNKISPCAWVILRFILSCSSLNKR